MVDTTQIQEGGSPAGDGLASAPAGALGFELLEEVGRGGMGVVWRARDRALNREVAVKLLQDRYAAESAAAIRFLEEAHITAQLQHPGIPAVYQVGTWQDGRPFLAMKLIKGQTLEALLHANSPIDLMVVIESISQAVGYAHAHGVIHRDLKPSNVMVGAFGEVQVMDWGLAKHLGPAGKDSRTASTPSPTTAIHTPRDYSTESTQYGSALGTPAYMPPEQAAGELDKIDTRSDVFGLGAILCILLTGRPPFEGTNVENIRANAHRGKTEAAFERLDACGADPDVVALCKRCLAFEPTDRPATANEVATAVAALRRAADDRARQAERDKLSAEVQAVEQAKRRRAVLWAAGVVAAVLLLGVAGTTIGMFRAYSAREAESHQRKKAEAKQAEADAVIHFIENRVFAAARPKGQDGGLGNDVTLRAAITASLPALAEGFSDQPLVEARLRMSLNRTFSYLGDAEEAATQCERARTIYTEWLGAEHPDTLSSQSNLASNYSALGRYSDAHRLFEETLAARKRVLGPDHPHTLQSMNNLALSYSDLDRPAEAVKLLEETLAIKKRVLLPDDEDLLSGMHNLANGYDGLGRHGDALTLREETTAEYLRVCGPDHPHTLMSKNNLAQSYAKLDRHGDALKLNQETLAVQKRVLPRDHPNTIATMASIGNRYFALGRMEDAHSQYEEALAASKRAFPPDHPETLRIMSNLASNSYALGRHSDALKWYEEVLATQKRVLPPNHTDTLMTRWGIAETLVTLNRSAEAVPVIDACVAGAAGKPVHPGMIPAVMTFRLQHFQKSHDPAGCRATAVLWENLSRTDMGSLYNAACMRAVTADEYARANQPAEAAVEADRAMAWLTRAVTAGFKDRNHIEKDADLTILRNRADFKDLLDSLPKSPEVAPPPRSGR